jgi:DNA polymerase-3 subunit epsilon
MYAIVDIETTGGNPKTDRITEIAILIHDGRKVISAFNSLINPECTIPYHISALTGITNEMVADAPRFYEIARQLVEITTDKVFVAHNVAFDYGFIRHEFKKLGYEFSREQLCTVRLSRKLLPGHDSYSLGKLCDDLQIPILSRHRAMGDAEATALLFNLLLEQELTNQTHYIRESGNLPRDLHPRLNADTVRKLPEEPGVYYFYNELLELIYIGKSRNIKSRVASHFANNTTGKAVRMRAQIADIGCEVTGSELIALLRESYEIKKHKPLFNKAQRRSLFRYGVVTFGDAHGYIRFSLEKLNEIETIPWQTFGNKKEALEFLNRMIDRFSLCQTLCGIYPSHTHCFHYEIGACQGACIGKESPESYNLRAHKALQQYSFPYNNLLIIDRGRYAGEKSVVKIENGVYQGYGYFVEDYAALDEQIVHECIQYFPDNREVQQIISSYLRHNKVEKLVAF